MAMMSGVNRATYDDVNLILRLYEQRREDRLREARRWFPGSFKVKTFEEFQALCPPGSEPNASYRMVTTYWEMVASFLTSGVMNAELFYQSGRELLLAWERVRDILPRIREVNRQPARAEEPRGRRRTRTSGGGTRRRPAPTTPSASASAEGGSMPVVTTALALIIFAAGTLAGGMGALLGLGGGVFLVPFLNLVPPAFPSRAAAAISLTTVIATSSTVSAGRAGQAADQHALGMLLEVATAAGSFLGGVTAQLISQSRAAAAVRVRRRRSSRSIMLSRLRRRNVILDPRRDPGVLGGRYHEAESGGTVIYRVKRAAARASVASFLAGNVSSLLGIGGGDHQGAGAERVVRHPAARGGGDERVHDRRDGDRRRHIYYGNGELQPVLAAAACLGVQLGSWGGMKFGSAASAKWLKIMMAVVLFIVSAMMFARGGR